MVYSDKFLEELPEDTVDAGLELIARAWPYLDRMHQNGIEDIDDRNALVEIHAVLNAFLEARGLSRRIPGIGVDAAQNLKLLITCCADFQRTWQAAVEKDLHTKVGDRSAAIFGRSFKYEFTEGDLARIQTLVNELRELISSSQEFDANHQGRLLRRLERLQAELHKRMSDLDRFWGLVGDAGVAVGKFGKDAKPMVDRFREIIDIIWRTQSRAEELPSGFDQPLLDRPRNDGE